MWWMLAAAAVQTLSKLKEGQASAARYKASAQASEYNAAVTRQRAETAYATSGMREAQFRRQAAIMQGRSRAAAAQSGTGLGGSNADIERQNMLFQEMDALNIRYAGDLEAYGLLHAADLEEYDADLARMSAKSARQGGFLGAAGSLLSAYGTYVGRQPTTTPDVDD